ncbi:MAG TPA: hypothetical protein P5511_08225, partial [Candidatus Goldiibacteriota bacterium]|nr:hypothetical protein [Candidatus Goldiibacteriota bacterium]
YGIDSAAGFKIGSLSTISVYISRGFYLVSDIVMLLAAGMGVFYIILLLEERLGVNWRFGASVFGLVPLVMLFSNAGLSMHSEKFFGYDHAMNIMKTMPEGSALFSRNDCPSFNLVYLKKVKGKYDGISVYDRDFAILDTSVYGKMTWKNTAAAPEVESRFVSENPGRVFFTEYYAREGRFDSSVYGIVYKAYTGDKSYAAGKALFGLYTLRDLYRNRHLDLFYRDFIAKYFLANAASMAENGDNKNAGIMLDRACNLANDSPSVLSEAARLSFARLSAPQSGIRYLKRMMELNPYDMKTLNLLMSAYTKANAAEALLWVESFYEKMPESEQKKDTAVRINELKKALERAVK